MKYLVLAGTGIILAMTFTFSIVSAQIQLEGGTYELELEQLDVEEEPQDIAPPKPTATPIPEIVDTVLYGEEKKQFDKQGFYIRQSAPAQKTIPHLRLSLSHTSVEFTDTESSVPQERPVTITVSSDSPSGYQVVLIQDTPLTSITGDTIANTECNPNDACTYSTASLWRDTGSFGYGYRIEGNDTPADFNKPAYFRSFPIRSLKQPAIRIMNNFQLVETRQSVITFKLNPPPSIQTATYQNTVTILAFPQL